MHRFALPRPLTSALLLSTAVSLQLAAQRQDTVRADTTRLPTTVVTATRTPIASDASPATVGVVTGTELRRRGIISVADALRGMPSFAFAQSGSVGSVTSLFLRGGESKYVKVLVDGVPVNDPGGAFDFSTLTTDNVDRIEVVRGPASVVYGADAVTGVIQIFTRRGAGQPRTILTARGGTRGSRDVDGTLLGAVGNGSFSISAARHDTRGVYDFNNSSRSSVLSAGTRVLLDDRTDVRASVRYTDVAYHYPTNGSGEPVDSNAFRTQDATSVAVDVGHFFTPRIETRLSVNANATTGGTDDRPDVPSGSGLQSLDHVRRRGAELRTNMAVAATTLSAGAQIEQQDQRSESQSMFGGSTYPSAFTAARRNRAVYAQVVTGADRAVLVTAGTRLDDNERFGRFGTYRVGASWRAHAGTNLRASAGSAFREPTFLENYSTAYTKGNPDLRPERTASWEIGVRQSFFDDQLTLGVTHFAQQFREMIDYTGSSTSPCGASYCNVARANADGREFEARLRATDALTVEASLSHLETRVVDPGYDVSSGGLYRSGEALIRRPTTSWNVATAYVGSRGSLDARLTRTGRRSDRDFSVYPSLPVVSPAYSRVDVGGELPLPLTTAAGVGAALTLRVENLLDAKYESVFNFRSPRRAILGGGRLTF
jgi:vitamin B12 transporter